MKKSWMTLPITAVFILGNMGSCFAAAFTDLNNVPWAGAVEYINDVANLGLMAGDTDLQGNRVFRAKDNVTYCEVTQLSYNLLKSGGKLGTTDGIVSKWGVVLNSYQIPQWAQESVAYGLENNVLSVNDVSKFMNSSGKSRTATREDTAVIFGKSLSQLKTPNATATLNFNDSSSVAATSVPYIDLLVELGVLAGDDQNNFNPKKNINRAEMAVIVSKTNTALKKIVEENTKPVQTEVSGTVISLDDQGMMTLLVNGKNLGFIGSSSVPVYNKGTKVDFFTIGKGDVVTVSYTGSTIHQITISYDAEVYQDASDTIKGELLDITNDGIFFRESGELGKNYELSSNLTLLLNGGSASMRDLQAEIDDRYTLTGTLTLGSDGKAAKLDVDRVKENELKGEITYLSGSRITIELDSGKEIDYDLLKDTDDITVKIDGDSEDFDTLQDYYDDDETIEVTLTLNSDDEVKRIDAEVDGKTSKNSSGEIKSLSKKSIKVDSKSYDIDDVDDLTIKVTDGTEESDLTDYDALKEALDDGKTIDVDLTIKGGYVTKITGEVTGIENAELLSIRTSNRTIIIELDSGRYTYEYERNADIELDKEDCDMEELAEALEDDDLELELILKDGVITEITADYL